MQSVSCTDTRVHVSMLSGTWDDTHWASWGDKLGSNREMYDMESVQFAEFD